MKTITSSGLHMICPAATARELQERVWDWSRRNLFWLLGNDAASLDWLDANLDALAKASLPEMPADRLLAVERPRALSAAEVARAQQQLTLSALSLRPGLDALLQRYGARLDPETPSLREALAGLDGNDDPLVARLREAREQALLLIPSDPGKPAESTRIACVFHVDEWPLTRPIERLIGIDPRVRDCVCWIMPEQPSAADLLDTIPEIDIPGARFDGLFAVIARYSWLFFQRPLSGLGPVPSTTHGCHTSASREAVEAFFREQGFRLLTVQDILARQRTWSTVRHERLARVGHDAKPWAHPELWDEAFPARTSRADRAELRRRALEDQGLWRRVAFESGDAHDGFARVREVLVEAGMSAPEVYASLAQTLPSFMSAGSWIWHFAAAIRDEPAVRAALVAAGFTRSHLAHLRQLLAGALSSSRVAVPALAMECAEVPLPPALDPAIAEAVQSGFPLQGDRFAIHLRRCSLDEGGLRAALMISTWKTDDRVSSLAAVDSVLLSPAQLRLKSAAGALQTRLQTLAALSHESFASLTADPREDPFQPFRSTVKPDLIARVDALFPLTLADGSQLSLRRVELRKGVLFAVASLTTFDAGGKMEAIREWEARKVLDTRGLGPAKLEEALKRRAESWRRADAALLEARFSEMSELDAF